MSSTVLFDTPGPQARSRHAILTVVAAVVALALLAAVLWKLAIEGEFEADLWHDLSEGNIWQAYLDGLLNTLAAAAAAVTLSILFGAAFAVARLSDHRIIRWPATVVVEFLRAIPVLLLMVFVFFGFRFGAYWSVVIALMLYNGSVLAEVFRAGILAVPRGQSEASYAIGMRKNQVMRMILLPQSISIMLPAIVSQCVIVLKDSSLGQIISFRELTTESQTIAQFLHHTIVPLGVAAVIYILINYSLSRFAVYLERRLSRRGRSSADTAAGHEVVAGVGQGGA